jgi:uncharacterized protein YeaO (DUF488 family)
MVQISTVQIAVAERLNLTNDARYLDITVKSGDHTFAPTWEMVMGVKQRRITEDEYTRAYYERMRESYRQNRRRWDEILRMDEVILACYCRADAFCHRYLLGDMLVTCGAEYRGEISSRGDLSRDRPRRI